MSSIAIGETLGMAVSTLWGNKLRTSLTMLGVVIGIAAVIAITAVGQGAQESVEGQLRSLGTDVIFVLAGSPTSNGNPVAQAAGTATTLTWDDAKAMGAQAPAVEAVAPVLNAPGQLVWGNKNINTVVVGTTIDYPIVRDFHTERGRFFNQQELDSSERVILLGQTAKQKLFGAEVDPIGQTLRLRGEKFVVIGLMETKGASQLVNVDDQVYIPLSTMASRIVGNNSLSGVSVRAISVKAKGQNQMEAAQFQLTNLLRLRHGIYPPQEDDFTVQSQNDLISALGGIVQIFVVLVAAIGAISLLVGGIGIMNIMLVSVTERTREIGIRKAIGATKLAILSQFLIEAVLVSLTGGFFGIFLGIAGAFAASKLMSIPFVLSPAAIGISFLVAVAVGLFFGVIPANRAAQLDPIAALRSD
jgi:putative ABC transport system permease protein